MLLHPWEGPNEIACKLTILHFCFIKSERIRWGDSEGIVSLDFFLVTWDDVISGDLKKIGMLVKSWASWLFHCCPGSVDHLQLGKCRPRRRARESRQEDL